MTQFTIPEAFDLALGHQKAGRLREAELLYRQILAYQPGNLSATHNLALLAHQSGRADIAEQLMRRAVAIDPNYAEGYNNLGNLLRETGKLDEAIAAYRRAIALKANYVEAYCNCSNALRDKGQLDEAIAACRAAIAIRPDHVEAHGNLGIALQKNGQLAEAIATYQTAIAMRPDDAQIQTNLGTALRDSGQFDRAIAAFRAAIELRPDYAEAHNNLGVALQNKGLLDAAIAAHREAIRIRPDHASAYTNLGTVLKDKGHLDEAIAAYRQAIALKPNQPEPHSFLALPLLLRGRFEEGWREYEWRRRVKGFVISPNAVNRREWDGSAPAGRTIFVHAEQGFGDAIQFVRYVPLLRQRGARVIFECAGELVRLMQRVVGLDEVQIVARGKIDASSLPPFDVHAPLMSLPLLLGVRAPTDELPRPPYINVEDELRGAWREKLGHSGRMKVGIAWAGAPKHLEDRKRSISLRAMTSVLQSGAEIYSLQFGEAAKQNWPGSGLIDLTADITDFLDTAALISELDLVICVDTAIAHLAGAMGKPTWVMLQYMPDWRWQLERDDSRWYPSLKLFRQRQFGQWDEVIERVAESLGERVRGVRVQGSGGDS